MKDTKLYHFTTFDNFKKIIESRKLFIFNVLSMKDTNELVSGLQLAAVAMDEYNPSEVENNKLADSVIEAKKIIITQLNKIKSNKNNIQDEYYFYVLSLCNDIDNEYLWQNYSDNSSGVAIEFSQNEIEGNISPFDEEELTGTAINFGTRESFIPYMPGYINNGVIKEIFYDQTDFKKFIHSQLEKLNSSEYINQNCTDWILLSILPSALAYKLSDESDFPKEKETRFTFNLSHTGTLQKIVPYFNQHMYDTNKLSLLGRKYIPLHLNPYSIDKLPLSSKTKKDIVLSAQYPFAHIVKVITGKNNAHSIEHIKELLSQNNFNSIAVEKH